jgi:hypothetical protein
MDIVIIAILAAVLFYLMFFVFSRKRGVSKRHTPRTNAHAIDRDFIAGRWAEIKAQTNMPGRGKSAVMEADKLLDYVLKAGGARGDTMADRLRDRGGRFSNINAIWSAHKLRNTFAHEMGFEAPQSQIMEAIMTFERGLKDLGAL